MKVTAIYFSPTGGTEKSVMSIAGALSPATGPEAIDITLPGQAQASFDSKDFVVFGTPCYKGRIPVVATDRLRKFQGKATPCVISVTYGNRDYDDALLEMRDLAEENGFVVWAAAALVGQHTFGQIQVGRPNRDDLEENANFARKLLALRTKASSGPGTLQIKGQRPYRGEGTGVGFLPLTSEACARCGKCVRECPVQAIAEDCAHIDPALCLSCFRCIRVCPLQAKNMNTDAYLKFAADFSQKLAQRKENEYFI